MALKQENQVLLSPFERELLQAHLDQEQRSEYRRRIEIMLLADLGKSQSQICATLNCSHETARFWISMAKAGQALQWNTISIGRPKTVSNQYINRLQELVTRNPQDYGYSFSRWTAQWLSKHLAKEFAIEISDRHINRLLKKMGLSTRSKSPSKQKENRKRIDGLTITDLNSDSKSQSFGLGPFNPVARDYNIV